MRWKDARRSDNVDDRRRMGGKQLAMGGGLGGIIMALLAIFVFKADPAQVLQQTASRKVTAETSGELTPAEVELGDFIKAVLGYTEDVWDDLYPRIARKYPNAPQRYQRPKLVLFSGQISSRCGHASAAMGPFYCPGDNQVYIDLSFYNELKEKFKAPGDFAQAYVIAHEVGHHVQTLLGINAKVHEDQRDMSKEAGNQMSVRLELQADYLAGCWAHQADQRWKVLERGDLEEGLVAAAAIGDDRIQKRMQGYVVPESFTHGSAEQRVRWFRRGLESGDPTAYDPFTVRYEDL